VTQHVNAGHDNASYNLWSISLPRYADRFLSPTVKMKAPLTAEGIPTSIRTERLKLRMLDPDNDKQCNEIISLVNGNYLVG
jgi:hypothetical protein